MRIGIDCLRADPGYAGGLNTYILGLLEGFAAVGGGHRFQLYVTQSNRRMFARFEGKENFEMVAVNSAGLRLRQAACRAALVSGSPELYRKASLRLFRKLRAAMDRGSDLIYTPTVSLLCFDHGQPTLLSMHDLQHLHYPEFFGWLRRRNRAITCGLSARLADYFQASSQFIKQDMLGGFPEIVAAQIRVIPEGVNLEDFAPGGAGAAIPNCLGGQFLSRFLFLPAQLWPHKNHLTVLRALERIERKHGLRIPLVMTGARYSAAPAIFRFLAERRMDYVRYLGTVPFDQLVALYQKAALVIAPGLYESNSLPVLEAAAAGTAVIASKIPPNEELAQALELNLFEARDDAALARLLLRLWRDEETCRLQAIHNRRQVAGFTWKRAARSYLSWMEEIVNAGVPARQPQAATVGA